MPPKSDSFVCHDCGRTLPIALSWRAPDGVLHCKEIAECWKFEQTKK